MRFGIIYCPTIALVDLEDPSITCPSFSIEVEVTPVSFKLRALYADPNSP